MWSISNLLARSPTCLVDIAKERARIARELHDGIAQDLAAIGYALDSEIGRADTHRESRKALRQIRKEITDLNSKVRNEIFRLRAPSDLQPQVQLEESLGGLEAEFVIIGALPDSPLGLELYKVLLELSRNANEHGLARQISIEISPTRILFSNDGGSSDKNSEAGFGLRGVSERLATLGWEITLDSNFLRMEILAVE